MRQGVISYSLGERKLIWKLCVSKCRLLFVCLWWGALYGASLTKNVFQLLAYTPSPWATFVVLHNNLPYLAILVGLHSWP